MSLFRAFSAEDVSEGYTGKIRLPCLLLAWTIFPSLRTHGHFATEAVGGTPGEQVEIRADRDEALSEYFST